MGRGVLEYGLLRAEQFELEQRTSDPADPDPDEEWFRVDIKPTYTNATGTTQTGVAEYRIANADGTVDTAPVAQLGDATEAAISDKRRAYIDQGGSPTGKGFIPYATQASGAASYPKRRFEHPSDGRLQMHNKLVESAIPDSVVDNYEEAIYEDQNQSLTDFYSGNTGQFTRQQTTVIAGSYTLEGHREGSTIRIESTSGLPNYPSQGDQFEFYIRGDQQDWGIQIGFGTQDASNEYRASFYNDLEIRISDAGSTMESASFSGNYVDETLRGVVNWHDGSDQPAGTIEFEIFDSNDTSIASVSATDLSYTSGGVSVRSTRVSMIADFHIYVDDYFLTGDAGS